MRIEKHKMKYKGQIKEFDIAIPESIQQAIGVLGAPMVYEDFVQGLVMRSKREALGIKKKKKRIIKLNIESLSDEQRQTLVQMGVLSK